MMSTVLAAKNPEKTPGVERLCRVFEPRSLAPHFTSALDNRITTLPSNHRLSALLPQVLHSQKSFKGFEDHSPHLVSPHTSTPQWQPKSPDRSRNPPSHPPHCLSTPRKHRRTSLRSLILKTPWLLSAVTLGMSSFTCLQIFGANDDDSTMREHTQRQMDLANRSASRRSSATKTVGSMADLSAQTSAESTDSRGNA